ERGGEGTPRRGPGPGPPAPDVVGERGGDWRARGVRGGDGDDFLDVVGRASQRHADVVVDRRPGNREFTRSRPIYRRRGALAGGPGTAGVLRRGVGVYPGRVRGPGPRPYSQVAQLGAGV